MLFIKIITLLNNHIKTIYNQNHIHLKYLDYSKVTVNDINLDWLSPKEVNTFHSFKSNKRKLEFFHLRLLWNSFNTQQSILYKPSGKPYLKKGFLSMTHSHHQVVIAYSPYQEIGVDIEMISNKIEKVKHKFLHPNDCYNSLTELTQLWTIKEAVYKLFDGDDVFFMDNIEIKDLSKNKAEINYKSIYLQSHFESFKIKKNFIVTIALQN